jgi:ATP-dependent DNA helicase RecQ
VGPPDRAVLSHTWGLFLVLRRGAGGGSCRHDAILRYFGDDAETLHGCCRCDVCASFDGRPDDDPEEVTLVVRKALSGVARVHGRFGLTAAAKLLKGGKDPRLERSGLERTRTFGVLQERPEAWIVKLLRRCVTAGWVDFSTDEHPVAFLTEDGKAVMKGSRPARLLLPSSDIKDRPSKVRSGGGGKRGPELDDLDADGLALFEALRHHRMERAKADAVPPYVVASDRTLREIAVLRPRTVEELSLAHGIGPTKVERYGEGLLRVVADARESTRP